MAIIDPEGSHQPIANEDDSVFMVFNGEIYNYKGLRRQLEEAGHRFATKGDGEAVVHGCEEWSTGVFERLRGMFAVAIWDDARHEAYGVASRVSEYRTRRGGICSGRRSSRKTRDGGRSSGARSRERVE